MRLLKFILPYLIMQLQVANNLFAQHLSVTQYIGEFGVHVGAVTHKGDIATDKQFYRPNFGFYYYKKLDKHLSLHLSYEHIPLGANDAKSSILSNRNRNFNYYRSFQEFSVLWGYHFNALQLGNLSNPIHPYIKIGMGYMLNLPTDNNNFMFYEYKIERLRDQIWPILTYPIAIGAQYPLENSIFIFSEINFRLTNSDLMDHFGIDYPVQVGTNTYRAPNNGYDYFYSFKIGIHYQWKKTL